MAGAAAWKTAFGAHPPRGVCARMARRCGANLHDSMRFLGYRNQKAFRKEMRRVYRWYKEGKRRTRRRTGILRTRGASEQVAGRATVMTKKMRAHFKRLFKRLRLEGLWKWKAIARSMREAGVPVQTGTVSVERFWAWFTSVLQSAGTQISPDWFEVLSMIAFCKYNYTHFLSGRLPTWCARDPSLSQRLDGFVAASKALEAVDAEHFAALFGPFHARA